jgi:HWE histidine kinase
MVRSEQRLQRALDEKEMLAREMSHRVNNLFAMTDGMIRVSARGAVTKDDLVQLLSGGCTHWHAPTPSCDEVSVTPDQPRTT